MTLTTPITPEKDLIISIQNVRKTYRLGETEVEALRGVSIDLAKGEFAAVVGPSGSGKSTLLNLIGTIDAPNSGRVLLEGKEVFKLPDDARSRLRNEKIGFIFQSFNLIPVLNVYENIELPLVINSRIPPQDYKKRILAALADVDISEYAYHLPDKLSGGQRQRVAIARALAFDPVLVLADEPTANLDSVTAHKIIDLMLDLNQKRKVTFLFSTHDEKLMNRVKRIIRIQDGMLVS